MIQALIVGILKVVTQPFCRCRSALILALLASCAVITAGCGALSVGMRRAKPGPVVVVVDRSVLGYQPREDQILELDSLGKSANETGNEFDLWSYDDSAQHLWGPYPLEAVDMIDSAENNGLARRSGTARGDVRPDLALIAIERTPLISSPTGRIYLLTDGCIRGKNALPQLKAALEKIAALPGWRLAVLGIEPQYAPLWKSAAPSPLEARLDLIDGKSAVALLQQNRDE